MMDETVVQDDLTTMRAEALRKLAQREFGMTKDEAGDFTPDELRDEIRRRREATRLTEAAKNSALAQGMFQAMLDHEEAMEAATWRIPVMPIHQLGRDCFVGSIKYADLSNVVVDREVQRDLAKRRVPALASYVTNGDGYFGAALMTVSGNVVLDEGSLVLDSTCKIVVNDGQHRIAGIKRAIEENAEAMAERMDDDLPVVIYADLSVPEQRQMFADVNLNAMKPNRAVALDYNQRDLLVRFAKALVEGTKAFGWSKVNRLKTKIGARDNELFTFSAIVDAVSAMFDDLSPETYQSHLDAAVDFWRTVDEHVGRQFDQRNFAINKNAVVAIASLRGLTIDWRKVGDLDWSTGGEMERVAREAGGTNAAIAAVRAAIVAKCAEEA